MAETLQLKYENISKLLINALLDLGVAGSLE
jgi:hypothetical protein